MICVLGKGLLPTTSANAGLVFNGAMKAALGFLADFFFGAAFLAAFFAAFLGAAFFATFLAAFLAGFFTFFAIVLNSRVNNNEKIIVLIYRHYANNTK